MKESSMKKNYCLRVKLIHLEFSSTVLRHQIACQSPYSIVYMWFYLGMLIWQTSDTTSAKLFSYFTASIPCLTGEITDSLGHYKI